MNAGHDLAPFARWVRAAFSSGFPANPAIRDPGNRVCEASRDGRRGAQNVPQRPPSALLAACPRRYGPPSRAQARPLGRKRPRAAQARGRRVPTQWCGLGPSGALRGSAGRPLPAWCSSLRPPTSRRLASARRGQTSSVDVDADEPQVAARRITRQAHESVKGGDNTRRVVGRG